MKKSEKKRKHSILVLKEQRAAYLFLIPAFLGLSLITYGPLLAVFGISVTDLQVGHFVKNSTIPPVQFVGLENFIEIFKTSSDGGFLNSIWVTVSYSLLAVVGSIIYSMFIAMLLNRKMPARGLFRAIFYVPYILPAAATMISFWFLMQDTGVLNYVLVNWFGMAKSKFLIDAKTVIPTLATIAVWASGNLIVIFLAGLQNVPRVYHEAAEIDGANFWQRYWKITIPCMTPIIFYNLLMSLVINLQVIVPAMTVTTGGPGKSTMFMSYLMYKTAFVNVPGKFGRAGAIAFVFFIVAAILAFILFATSKSWIFYEGGDDK